MKIQAIPIASPANAVHPAAAPATEQASTHTPALQADRSTYLELLDRDLSGAGLIPATQQTVLRLVYEQSLSVQDAARALGVSPQLVMALQRNGIASLRTLPTP